MYVCINIYIYIYIYVCIHITVIVRTWGKRNHAAPREQSATYKKVQTVTNILACPFR